MQISSPSECVLRVSLTFQADIPEPCQPASSLFLTLSSRGLLCAGLCQVITLPKPLLHVRLHEFPIFVNMKKKNHYFAKSVSSCYLITLYSTIDIVCITCNFKIPSFIYRIMLPLFFQWSHTFTFKLCIDNGPKILCERYVGDIFVYPLCLKTAA